MLALITVRVFDYFEIREFTLLNNRRFNFVAVGNFVVINRINGRRVVGTVIDNSNYSLDINQANGSGRVIVEYQSIYKLWFESVNSRDS
jgi:hypothetical protein